MEVKSRLCNAGKVLQKAGDLESYPILVVISSKVLLVLLPT